MKSELTDLEYVKTIITKSGLHYIEKEATETTDHILILGFDKKGRQIQGIVHMR